MAVIASAGWSDTPMPIRCRWQHPSWQRWPFRLALIAGYASAIWAALLPGAGQAETLDPAAFADLARQCGASVAPSTLAAVAKTESGFRTLIVSDNRTRKVRNFESIAAATATAEQLIGQGHSVDLGLMQINSANLPRLGYTARDALEACKSISGGALILGQNYLRSRGAPTPQIALRHALSLYNTGSIRKGLRNGYVRRVETAARALARRVARLDVGVLAGPAKSARTADLSIVDQPSAIGRWDVWSDTVSGDVTRPGKVLIF